MTETERNPTLVALRQGKVVEFEGAPIRMAEGEIEPGDTYIGERWTGPKLLTAREIKMAPCSACEGAPEESCQICGGPFRSYVIPQEMAYCYDYWECVKVELVEESDKEIV